MWQDVADLVRRIDAAVEAGDAAAVGDLVSQLEAARTPVAGADEPAPGRRRRSRLAVLGAVALLVAVGVAQLSSTGGSDETDSRQDDGFAEVTTTIVDEFDETTLPPETVLPPDETGDRETMSPIAVGSDGILDVELVWSSPADLDLAVVEPNGETVDVASGQSATGGAHGGDSNVECLDDGSRETATWDRASAGRYQLVVRGFDVAACGDGAYLVTVRTTQGTSTAEGSVTDGEVDRFDLRVASLALPTTSTTSEPVPAGGAGPDGEEEASEGDDASLATLVGLALLSGLAAAALTRGVDLLRRRSGTGPMAVFAGDARPSSATVRPRLPAPAELRELANHAIHRLDVARP